MKQETVRCQKIGETELLQYIKENREAALELYNALAGTDCNIPEQIEMRENADTCFLAKKGGAVFAFSKEKK